MNYNLAEKEENRGLARMRTIHEALALIKQADPDTAVTYNLIQRMVKANQIRYFLSGKKVILNYDDLLGVLNMA